MEYASVDLPEPFGPMMACVSPCFTVRSTPRRISRMPSAPPSTLTCRSLISSVATSLLLQVLGACQLVVDTGEQTLLDIGQADPLDDVGEEAAHHEPSGGRLVDAARHQVEQLLVVEAAGRAGVTCAGH